MHRIMRVMMILLVMEVIMIMLVMRVITIMLVMRVTVRNITAVMRMISLTTAVLHYRDSETLFLNQWAPLLLRSQLNAKISLSFKRNFENDHSKLRILVNSRIENRYLHEPGGVPAHDEGLQSPHGGVEIGVISDPDCVGAVRDVRCPCGGCEGAGVIWGNVIAVALIRNRRTRRRGDENDESDDSGKSGKEDWRWYSFRPDKKYIGMSGKWLSLT